MTTQHLLKLSATAAVALMLSACATHKHGAFEKITINSNPPGALCKIYREGQGFVKSIATPGAKYIGRADAPVTIVCSKRGYQTATVVLGAESVNNPSAVANFGAPLMAGVGTGTPFGGIIGFAVDSATGARYSVANQVDVTLIKAE